MVKREQKYLFERSYVKFSKTFTGVIAFVFIIESNKLKIKRLSDTK